MPVSWEGDVHDRGGRGKEVGCQGCGVGEAGPEQAPQPQHPHLPAFGHVAVRCALDLGHAASRAAQTWAVGHEGGCDKVPRACGLGGG